VEARILHVYDQRGRRLCQLHPLHLQQVTSVRKEKEGPHDNGAVRCQRCEPLYADLSDLGVRTL